MGPMGPPIVRVNSTPYLDPLLEWAGDLVRVPKGLLKGIYRVPYRGSIGFRVSGLLEWAGDLVSWL